jgi:hypothetical protein
MCDVCVFIIVRFRRCPGRTARRLCGRGALLKNLIEELRVVPCQQDEEYNEQEYSE